jgi:hypothetical protein
MSNNIKLKNLLAENMRRFGTKNLREDAGSLKFAKKPTYNSVKLDILDAAEDLSKALATPRMEDLPVVHHAISQLKKWTDAKKPAPLAVYMLVAEAPALLDKMQAKSKRAWDEMASHWGGIIDAILDEDEDEYVTDYQPGADDLI